MIQDRTKAKAREKVSNVKNPENDPFGVDLKSTLAKALLYLVGSRHQSSMWLSVSLPGTCWVRYYIVCLDFPERDADRSRLVVF
jgi:hypothetical protein